MPLFQKTGKAISLVDYKNIAPSESLIINALLQPLKYSSGNSFFYGSVSLKDWYKIYPYQFIVEDTSATPANPDTIRKYIYTLPIPPDAMSVQMVSAS